MASLYKKPIVKRDPRTGEKVKLKSKKWWGRYRDEHDVERRVPLATDKSAAQAMLNELVVKVERRKAGKLDPFEEHAKRPISEHVDDFEAHLRNKQNTAKHVQEVSTHVRKFVAGCKWSFLRDLSASDVQQYLADRRAGGLSVQTSNHYLRGIKQFSRWLVRDRRARRTSKMMLTDLKAARKKWIEEAKTPEEKEARKQSDFLSYCDENGLYADFHANRHTFITNLSRVGVKPRTAQSLARHSDIRLTMGVYTHIALMDQAEAIETLPAPPRSTNGNGNGKATGRRTRARRRQTRAPDQKNRVLVPRKTAGRTSRAKKST
jgi:integrase